jgi:RNA polymerase sigma factor (sigma-70 family)
MGEKKTLTERFEVNRAHLRSVAYRMLGSQAEADDAVQEAFLRLMSAESGGIDNITGWLTTVVARICLDMLRDRKSRAEVPVDSSIATLQATDNPERERLIADSIGVAMLVVLETLEPAERVAFVLHDLFNISFDEIAPIVGRSPTAARQLASRGRRRIQSTPATPDADRSRQREIIRAFLAASQSGDFGTLLAILDPNVVLRADAAIVAASRGPASQMMPALSPEIYGRDSVANIFHNRAKTALLATVDGYAVLAFAPGGQPRVLVEFVVEENKIAEIGFIADPEQIAALDVRF